MDLLVPEVISLISKLGAMMVLIKTGFIFGVVEFTAIALLCNVLCREGVQSNVVYLGGFSMRG